MASAVSLCLLVCLVCVTVTTANERDPDSKVDQSEVLEIFTRSKRSLRDRWQRRRQRQQAMDTVGTNEEENSVDPSGMHGMRRRTWRLQRRGQGQGRRGGARQGQDHGVEAMQGQGRRFGARRGQGRVGNADRRQARIERHQERINARIAAGEISLSEMSPRARRFVTFLTNAVTAFTVTMHHQLKQQSQMIYSPYGIYKALSMSYMGAGGLTAFQMKHILGLQGLGRQCHRAHKKMGILLMSARNITIKTPSTVILKEGADIVQSFSQRLHLLYMTNITRINMEHEDGPEASVNDWISSQTENHISSILSSGSITEETDLILVNGVYFNSKWKTAFQSDGTSEEMFKKTPTEDVPVQMMQMESLFRLGQIPNQNGRVLEVPFQDDRFSMLIYLPDESTNLDTIEDGLTTQIISVNLGTVIPTLVHVQLPKFTIESSWSLKNHLQGIGLTKPFDAGTADFGLLANLENLRITDVVHKTVFAIDEEGASTAQSGTEGTAASFRCDHPFLFVIRHNSSKMPIIVGKFSGRS